MKLKSLLILLLPLAVHAQEVPQQANQKSMAGITSNLPKETYIFNPSQTDKSIKESLMAQKDTTLYTQGWTTQACYPHICPLRNDIYASAIDDFKAHHSVPPKVNVVVDGWVCGRHPQNEYQAQPCDPIDGLAVGKICLQGQTNTYCNPHWEAKVFYLGAAPNEDLMISNQIATDQHNCNFSGMISDRVFLEQYMTNGVCYMVYRNIITNFKVVDIGGTRIDLRDRSILLDTDSNPFVVKELMHNEDKSCTFDPPDKDLYLEHVWSRDIHSYTLDIEHLEQIGFPSCP